MENVPKRTGPNGTFFVKRTAPNTKFFFAKRNGPFTKFYLKSTNQFPTISFSIEKNPILSILSLATKLVSETISPFKRNSSLPMISPCEIGAEILSEITIFCSILISFPLAIKVPQSFSGITSTVGKTPLSTFIDFIGSFFLEIYLY